MKRLPSGSLFLPLVIAALGPVHAQTRPDAGSLQQQIERDRKLTLPPAAPPERLVEPTAMKSLAGEQITVKAFRFSGNSLLSTAQLTAATEEYRNRSLDFAQLKAVATLVATVYREAGWVVRAYLPAQDIVDGVVTIQIVEAVFGRIQREGPDFQRLDISYVLAMFEQQQKIGEPLNANALDRVLLLADDLPGIAVSGSLRGGTQERETDLVLKVADEPLVIGEVTLDNSGSRSTGTERLAANLNLNSPLGLGDLISTSLIATEGSNFLRLGFTVPVGLNGWRVGINASTLGYKLVAPEFASLKAKGTSDAVALDASYPLVRSRLRNLYFNASVDQKKFDNQSSGATTSRYRTDTVTLGLSGNLFDSLGGGGANSASLSWVDGVLNLDDSPNRAADAATTQAAGHYSKLRYALSRQQVITPELSFFAALNGQVASKNLDSSENFYLGGANGVRAYPANEGGGSEGRLANLELRWRLAEGINLTGFYDYGAVTVNRSNSYTGAAAPNAFSLRGYGTSVAWQSGNGPTLKAMWARRIGDNPNATSAGNDQDGTLVKNRFWLAASLPF